MGQIMLGVGEIGASGHADDVIRTLALGSCVALVFLDPAARVAGMAHVALPESAACPERAADRPGYCADTAVPALMQRMVRAGASSSIKAYLIKLAGGAHMMNAGVSFDVGRRNVLAIRRILWQMGTGPVAEDVGGNFSRNAEVRLDTGSVALSSPGRPAWTI